MRNDTRHAARCNTSLHYCTVHDTLSTKQQTSRRAGHNNQSHIEGTRTRSRSLLRRVARVCAGSLKNWTAFQHRHIVANADNSPVVRYPISCTRCGTQLAFPRVSILLYPGPQRHSSCVDPSNLRHCPSPPHSGCRQSRTHS